MNELSMKDMPDGGLTWDGKKEKPLLLELNDAQIKMLKEGLEILDKEKRLNDEIIGLAIKIKELE